MTVHPEISHLPRDERIRLIAYAIWEEEGRPDGRDLDHWARAAELVGNEAGVPADPDWLQRQPAEAETPAEAKPDKPSLDDMVKRMRGTKAA